MHSPRLMCWNLLSTIFQAGSLTTTAQGPLPSSTLCCFVVGPLSATLAQHCRGITRKTRNQTVTRLWSWPSIELASGRHLAVTFSKFITASARYHDALDRWGHDALGRWWSLFSDIGRAPNMLMNFKWTYYIIFFIISFFTDVKYFTFFIILLYMAGTWCNQLKGLAQAKIIKNRWFYFGF